jgi:hypothetical protein
LHANAMPVGMLMLRCMLLTRSAALLVFDGQVLDAAAPLHEALLGAAATQPCHVQLLCPPSQLLQSVPPPAPAAKVWLRI